MSTALPTTRPQSVSSRVWNSEVLIASALVTVLLVMVVPLPTFMVDMLLAINIASSVAVLLTAFYATRTLEMFGAVSA